MKNAGMWILLIAVVVLAGYAGMKLLPKTQKTTPVSQAQPMPSGTPGAMSHTLFKMMQNGTLGRYMTDERGMTLYTYDKDTPGTSTCTGSCLTKWPAFSATETTNLPANLSVITRPDGTKQYAWMGKPLYYWQGDKAPGDTTGNGIGGVWHIVK
ncbi:hypothetical protein M1555_00980 [Patescibacteria group bacterium]|nr:hypothetical protein [Patescibacteria group bacterium]